MSNRTLIPTSIWGCISFHQPRSNTDYQLPDTPFANKELDLLGNYFSDDSCEPLVRPQIWIRVTFIRAKGLTWCVGLNAGCVHGDLRWNENPDPTEASRKTTTNGIRNWIRLFEKIPSNNRTLLLTFIRNVLESKSTASRVVGLFVWFRFISLKNINWIFGAFNFFSTPVSDFWLSSTAVYEPVLVLCAPYHSYLERCIFLCLYLGQRVFWQFCSECYT